MEFTTIVGRLVQGDVFAGQDKDDKGQPLVIKTGPNAGQPTKRWFFAVAFPKVLANGQPNAEFDNFRRSVMDVARAGYPQFFNGPIDAFTGKPGCTHPRMTYKIADGDGTDANGKSNAAKEGFAGHWVVKFSSMYPPRVFELGKFAPEQAIQDPSRVKRGYYVAVSGTCDPNTGSDVPGVYMNGDMVCLVGAGPEIVSGPNAGAAFGGLNTAALPAGCVVGATPANVPPLPNVGAPAPGVPSVPAAPGTLPTSTVGAVSVVPAAVVQTPPHDANAKALADGWTVHPTSPTHMYKGSDVKLIAEVLALYPAPVAAPAVPAVPAIPAPPAIPVPPVAAGLTLTAAGAALGTVDTFRANGWTDDMLVQNGYATRG